MARGRIPRLAAILLAATCATLHASWEIVSTNRLESPHASVDIVEIECRSPSARARVTMATCGEGTTLRVLDSPSPGVSTLAGVMARVDALAGVNGGYFHRDLTPIGLVVSDGQTLHPLETAKLLSGLVIVRGASAPTIIRTAAYNKGKPPTQALQSGPMLLEDGKPVAGLHADKIARRTFVATSPDGRFAIGYITSVTLADAARILALPGVLGSWGKVDALNLDGGSSTAFWSATGTVLPGFKKARNFLAVVPRR